MMTSILPRPVLTATATASAVTVLVGLVWLLFPGLNPYTDPSLSLLRAVVPLTPFTVALTAVALLGALTAAIAAIAAVRPEAASRPLRVVAPIVTVTMLACVSSLSGLSVAGYLVALLLPGVAVAAGVVAAVRAPRARLPLAVAAGLAIVLVVFGGQAWLGAVGFALAAIGEKWIVLVGLAVMLTTAALWLTCTVRMVAASGRARKATAFVVRHRVLFTVLAALGPVPYAVHRLSWLTPWPMFLPEGADSSTAAWGVALSAGGWMGAILTIGLIRPWGERFPRWMPVVGGTTVPPAFAVVPGSIVAGLLCLAAVPWLSLLGPTSMVTPYFWLLPVWLWGPMLALAVWGYAGHRAATAPHDDTDEDHGATMPNAGDAVAVADQARWGR